MADERKGELDCSGGGQNVWLVKVPKYLAEKWESSKNVDVGKIKITKTGGKSDIVFELDNHLIDQDQSGSSVSPGQHRPGPSPTKPLALPKKHKFIPMPVTNMTLGVFSVTTDSSTSQCRLEGRVAQKVECKPLDSQHYMNLKKHQVELASRPARQAQRIEKMIVNSYKPVSNHAGNLEFDRKKKEEGKRSRDDKQKVMDVLFTAFEKHQYYNLRDLQKLSNQPVTYLKEILKEIGSYNMKNPHKNMWELKPEYRHYKPTKD